MVVANHNPDQVGVPMSGGKKMKMVGRIAFGTLAVLSLPVALPVMLLRNILDARHQRRIANGLNCQRCGMLLGEAAIRESNRLIAEEFNEAQRKHPGVKLRWMRRHHAVCPHCGQKYRYSDQGKTYLPVVDDH